MIAQFYLRVFFAFAVWKTLSVVLHYYSASPWGGPLVLQPDRLLPDTLLIEFGLLSIATLFAALVEKALRTERQTLIWRGLYLASCSLYAIFSQLDQEVVRWLGQHMTLSYIQNYIGARDGQMASRILSGDIFWTSVAAALMALSAVLSYVLWRREARNFAPVGARGAIGLLLVSLVFTSAHQWFRPSEKRWRRIRPAVLVIAQDLSVAALGTERPNEPLQAAADLVALARTGAIADAPAVDEPTFPLWRDDNLGELSRDAFQALPLEERPDIVFIVFETLRGWNTGLVPHPSLEEGSPELNRILRAQATYFPYMHSAGFPSVEGCMGMHLGVWPHFRKIFLSDYGHIRSQGFPEVLREFGYETSALLGADPSFSNFTPWIERWYGQWEYNPEVHHDGPLVDRFIERYEESKGDQPRLMMMWTATTHPPYDVPEDEGVVAAEDSEGRFLQALHYSDRHIARLLDYLRASEDWSRTIVVVVGDHAQPTPEQWLMADTIGNLTPGNTWTVFGITGGWHGLPSPHEVDTPVSHLDIAPTLLSLLNIRAGNHFMGRDLLREGADLDGRPVVSFRYGDVSWQQGDERILFRLDSDAILRSSFDRRDALQYGALPGAEILSQAGAPDQWPVERWRDAIRYYGTLLDENRLMPPQEADIPASEASAQR